MILQGILSNTKSYGAETLTIVTADPEFDKGDPKEQTTHYNKDLSWDEEIETFADYIINDMKVFKGSSMDALQTMKLVYKIYHADPLWRKKYSIQDPDKL